MVIHESIGSGEVKYYFLTSSFQSFLYQRLWQSLIIMQWRLTFTFIRLYRFHFLLRFWCHFQHHHQGLWREHPIQEFTLPLLNFFYTCSSAFDRRSRFGLARGRTAFMSFPFLLTLFFVPSTHSPCVDAKTFVPSKKPSPTLWHFAIFENYWGSVSAILFHQYHNSRQKASSLRANFT